VYKQVWIWALRNFSELGGRSPRKERSHLSHSPTLDPQVHFNFSKFAKDLGISTRKIESRLERDPKRERLWESMHQMYPLLTETKIDKMVAALLKQLPPVRPSGLAESTHSQYHKTGAEYDLGRRWGVPFLDSYNMGKDLFFLTNISRKANMADHNMPNTLFIFHDFIVSFFGKVPEFEIGEEFDFDSVWKGKKRLSHTEINSAVPGSQFNDADWNTEPPGDPEHDRPNTHDTNQMDIDPQDEISQSEQFGQGSMEEDEEPPNSSLLFDSSRKPTIGEGRASVQENRHSSTPPIPANRISYTSTVANNIRQGELSYSVPPIQESRGLSFEKPQNFSADLFDLGKNYRPRIRSVTSSSDDGSTSSGNQSTYPPSSTEEVFRDAPRSPVLPIKTQAQLPNQETEVVDAIEKWKPHRYKAQSLSEPRNIEEVQEQGEEVVQDAPRSPVLSIETQEQLPNQETEVIGPLTQWQRLRSNTQFLGEPSNIEERQEQSEEVFRDSPRMSFVHPGLNPRSRTDFPTSQNPSGVEWSEQGLKSPSPPSDGLVPLGRSPVMSLKYPNEPQHEQNHTIAPEEYSNEEELGSPRLDDTGVAKNMSLNLQGPPDGAALSQTPEQFTTPQLQPHDEYAPTFDNNERMENASETLDLSNPISPPAPSGDNNWPVQEESQALGQYQSEMDLFEETDSDQHMDYVAQPADADTLQYARRSTFEDANINQYTDYVTQPAATDTSQYSRESIFEDAGSGELMDYVAQPASADTLQYARGSTLGDTDSGELMDYVTQPAAADTLQYARRSIPLPLPYEQPSTHIVNVTQNILVSYHHGFP
jgi:hypothetical protein